MGRSLLAFYALYCFSCLEYFFPTKVKRFHSSLFKLESKRYSRSSESAVVRVKAAREKRVDNKVTRLLKMGSGFFISKEGHVLTTGLLQDADRIWVEHRNSYFLAKKSDMTRFAIYPF